MRAEDPEFTYSVQVDDDGRVKTLMWMTGRSIEQFKCFGDAVTFDTTYKTNLYDMPFPSFSWCQGSVQYAGGNVTRALHVHSGVIF